MEPSEETEKDGVEIGEDPEEFNVESGVQIPSRRIERSDKMKPEKHLSHGCLG
jgi:hypothetical protein